MNTAYDGFIQSDYLMSRIDLFGVWRNRQKPSNIKNNNTVKPIMSTNKRRFFDDLYA